MCRLLAVECVLDPEVVKRLVAEGEVNLKFVAKFYRKQYNRGRYFFHEHPAGAKSWHHRAILRLRELTGVDVAKADQCIYGLKTRGDTAESSMPAIKPTRFMSNSPHMLKHLGRRCDKTHRHQQVEGGRCADAAFYPLPLIRAILRGMHGTARADQHAQEETSEKLRNVAAMMFSSRNQSEPNESVSIGNTKMKKVGGGEIKVDFNTISFKTRYFDEYTGEPLPNHLVRAAMMEERNVVLLRESSLDGRGPGRHSILEECHLCEDEGGVVQ